MDLLLVSLCWIGEKFIFTFSTIPFFPTLEGLFGLRQNVFSGTIGAFEICFKHSAMQISGDRRGQRGEGQHYVFCPDIPENWLKQFVPAVFTDKEEILHSMVHFY